MAVPVNKEPPIPTPPVTTKAPEVVDTETTELVMLVVPPINEFPVILNPPLTWSDPVVVELD